MTCATSETGPIVHGGDLGTARRLFPDAPAPLVDLSTGINPWPYPIPQFPPDVFARLPQTDSLSRLRAAAAAFYGVPAGADIVAAPGTQILLPRIAALVPPGRAAVLAPTYGEYARAARFAGHAVAEADDLDALQPADLAFLANPNNPDGRMIATDDLLALADHLRGRGALLVVDEAFIDVAEPGSSLAAAVGRGNLIVLRSFGKFFGLAGLRLGFALADPGTASRLERALGPWAVAGPAIFLAETALVDTAWHNATRIRLAEAAARLDRMLTRAGLQLVGGTSLFRLAAAADARRIVQRLGRDGILVRHFPEHPTWLRFGLPANEAEWQRLAEALAGRL